MKSDEFKNKVIPFSPRLFSMAARLLGDEEEARDAVQDIMMKLWNSRQTLDQHPNMAGYVFLTGRNYCLDLLRTRKNTQAYFMYEDIRSDTPTKQGEYELKEVYALINQIIDKLPENQKEVILMRDLDGLEFKEIAAITSLKVEHIRVLLSRARKNVTEELEKIYQYEQGTGK